MMSLFQSMPLVANANNSQLQAWSDCEFLCPRLDALQVAQEQGALLPLAVLLGNAKQETGVDRDPAFAAVGERERAPRLCR